MQQWLSHFLFLRQCMPSQCKQDPITQDIHKRILYKAELSEGTIQLQDHTQPSLSLLAVNISVAD